MGRVILAAASATAGVNGQAARVVAGSKVFITPHESGIHTALAGALSKKKVPVTVVTIEDKADYVITVVGEHKRAGWIRTIRAGGYAKGDARASMTVGHRESGEVAFAYNVEKEGAWNGIQSAAESCAKTPQETHRRQVAPAGPTRVQPARPWPAGADLHVSYVPPPSVTARSWMWSIAS